jgi:NAD(P)-dependent dehydrogenase (short-subunit alcohol dehydrogenase family)
VQRMAGKVALVTGAGSGIGRAIAGMLASEGACVGCLDLDRGSTETTVGSIQAAGGKAVGDTGDVSNSNDAQHAVKNVVRQFGALHVLINNAAVFLPDRTLAEIDEAMFDRAIAVNIGGAFRMSRFAIPEIIRSGGGSIIHVSSQMGHVGKKHQATYCAAKGALLMLAKAMALDHAAEGIRVNTISPGGIATESMARQWGTMEAAEREWGAKMHPLGRLGRVEEIARAAVFLASEESSFVTGTDILVDGGYTAL